MQIRPIIAGGQPKLRKNIINVENDLDVCASVLPRKFDDTSTVHVQLMRQMCNPKPYMYEVIRPKKVYEAAKYLMSCELYKSQNVAFCDDWRLFENGIYLDFFKCFIFDLLLSHLSQNIFQTIHWSLSFLKKKNYLQIKLMD